MNGPPTLRFLLAKQAFACFPNMQLRHSSRRYMHKLLQAMNVPFTCMEHVQSGTQALHVGWTCKKFAVCALIQTHNPSLPQFFSTVFCDLRAPSNVHLTLCPCICKILEGTHEARLSALEWRCNKTRELIGGTRENRISLTRGH